MGLRVMTLLALLASLLILSNANGVCGRRSLSMEEDLEFTRQLKHLNKPAVKSIKMSSLIPKETPKEISPSRVEHLDLRLQGGGCPSGTVPIRRTTKEDLIRWKSFSNSSGNIHQFLNEGTGKTHVNPKLYGDNKTHIFGHWTADGFLKTGCFNYLCNGFVQVSKSLALGQILTVHPITHGHMPVMPMFLYQNIYSKNWFVAIGDGKMYEAIGYWPPELFDSIKDFAPVVGWRGEVYAPQGEFGSKMGTGQFPQHDSASSQWQSVASFSVVRVYNETYIGVGPYDPSLKNIADETIYYDVIDFPYIDDEWRHTFFYGGPGEDIFGPPLESNKD
ncbi:hypothetical protein NE237_023968 [Protea cynaroides]|uniref:Neprosin PEP catalytic domain-containing protein n=1 Tax=Protea cynaroides TaxID=273540 RepID=A0A9Q0HHY1_9MAGN|nr:hypothetical protein NE237_023968 [Protea cynaroides]